MKKLKVYIISNRSQGNNNSTYTDFSQVEFFLQKNGLIVMNPLKTFHADLFFFTKPNGVDLKRLVRSDAVYILPEVDWKCNINAELKIALALNLFIFHGYSFFNE